MQQGRLLLRTEQVWVFSAVFTWTFSHPAPWVVVLGPWALDTGLRESPTKLQTQNVQNTKGLAEISD